MTQLILALEKGPGFSPIKTMCAVHGETAGLRGEGRQYADVGELVHALAVAGVASHVSNYAVKAIMMGYPSFLTLTKREATSLGVLFIASEKESAGDST